MRVLRLLIVLLAALRVELTVGAWKYRLSGTDATHVEYTSGWRVFLMRGGTSAGSKTVTASAAASDPQASPNTDNRWTEKRLE